MVEEFSVNEFSTDILTLSGEGEKYASHALDQSGDGNTASGSDAAGTAHGVHRTEARFSEHGKDDLPKPSGEVAELGRWR